MKQPPVLGGDTPHTETQNRLAVFYQPIAEELSRVDEVLRRELRSRYSFVNSLVEHVGSYRGKRLRPALVLLTARSVGELREDHVVLAAVVEMIHTATLVHDDVLDQALVRRHKATVNAEWGNESSVLLGDYLFTHAFHLAASLGSTLACRLIGQATNTVCEGELHQIYESGNLDLDERDYLDIIAGKTAELCAVCCRLGAHYAGAPPALEDGMVRYGQNLGMAFQIADDLLDLQGEERSTGKSLGSDADQQKLTLPLIRVLRQGSSAVVRNVQRILAGAGNHKRQQLLPILEESDAFEYARQQAERYAAAACAELDEVPDSDAKEILLKLTRFVTRRSA